MRRRSYRLMSADSVFDVEIVQRDAGKIEVVRTDDLGEPVGDTYYCTTWKEALIVAGGLVGGALSRGLV